MDTSQVLVTASAGETEALGEAFGHTLITEEGTGRVRTICLWGDLGSGKTTFTKGIAKSLGITSRLLSPTFIIVRRYDVSTSVRRLYHIDLYRLTRPDEAEGLGFSEIISDPDAIVIIEWPERLGVLMPDSRIDVRFDVRPDGKHDLAFSTNVYG